ncbi:MAG: phage tail tape measure protein [Roseitalea sp.]|jgi:phage-related minor tail protein|nr:phage tail tape measure protein [Roseitalea sp.]MBO6720533.1 phage tail tape measure protein [Roseitalea sp.]MBO6743680.1 phage tail tape measure protein [Roseitalea sp.]
MDEELIVTVDADTTGLEMALATLRNEAESFGQTMTGALGDIVIKGKSVEDVLRGIAMSMSRSALNQGLAPLQSMFDGFGPSVLGGLFGSVTPFAAGGVASTGLFAGGGGVLAAPAYFPHGGGLGVAGEAGAEAILPLRRGADGRLGVAAGGQGEAPMQVVVNISTPDIKGFERSQSQVSAALTRAVMRGRRGV